MKEGRIRPSLAGMGEWRVVGVADLNEGGSNSTLVERAAGKGNQ